MTVIYIWIDIYIKVMDYFLDTFTESLQCVQCGFVLSSVTVS